MTKKLYTPYELFAIECDKGWESLYLPLIALCKEHNIQITQIKEKYGGLRFYVGYAPDWFYDLVDEAEKKSVTICESCGAPGEIRGTIWYKTLCDKCNEKNTAYDKDSKPENML